MKTLQCALLSLVLLSGGVGATLAEDVSMPRPRPASERPVTVAPGWIPSRTIAVEVPAPRPDTDAPAKSDDKPAPAAETAPPKPPRIYQTACPAVIAGTVVAESLPPIADGGQCGAVSPLALSAVMVNGREVPVSGGVVTDCGIATVLPTWLGAVDGYLGAKENTGLKSVIVGTSYMCRPVNNAAGGNLSFHGLADALDVVGFELEDGRRVEVEKGWADALSSEGRLLRFAHDAACASFTTTLGPEANAEHHDHLHVDLGCHGKTCTARLCE
jgi:hypothetical protein